MAYTLKSGGLADLVLFCFIVDDDGSTILELKGNAFTQHANVTTGSASWKGTSRGYFLPGSAGGQGITLTTPVPFSTYDSDGCAVFTALAGCTAGGFGGTALRSVAYIGSNLSVSYGNGLYYSTSTGKFNFRQGSVAGGAVSTATSPSVTGTVPYSIGANYKNLDSAEIFYGLESGTLALDNTNSAIGNYGTSSAALYAVGALNDSWLGAKMHVVAGFSRELTESEFQSLHNDWFGVLVDSGGVAPTAPAIGTTTSITQTGATANWTDNSSDETGFKVEYAVSPYTSWTAASNSPAAANATSLAVTGLSAGTTYKFRVAATNGSGDSSWVESATFTTTSVVKGVQIQLHDGATEQASLTGITALWWDSATPSGFGAPVYATASATTDGTGWLELNLNTSTSLSVGGTGFLLIYKAGATAADDLVFAGRLAVVDIE